MTLDDALKDIIQSLGSADGGGIISWNDVQYWPKGALDIFLKAGLLKPTMSAQSVECPGCEDNCFMPVHALPAEHGRPARAFIACDRRDDIGRIKITQAQLQQCQITGMQAAIWIAGILGMKGKPGKKKTKGVIRLGVLRESIRQSPLEMDTTTPVSLMSSGHSLLLTDVIYSEGGQLQIDRDIILALVDREPSEAADSYNPSTARREANKLGTQEMYKSWNKAYRESKKERPGMSKVWYSQQIAKMPIAKGKSPDTIRKQIAIRPISVKRK